MTVLISDHHYPLISIGEPMTEPLTEDEERALREALAAPLSVRIENGLAYALARAQLPTSMETSRDYAERLAPFLIESRYLPELDAARGSTGLTDELRALSEAATPGRWRSFGMALMVGGNGDFDDATEVARFYTMRDGHPRTFDLDLAIAAVNHIRALIQGESHD